MSSVSYNIRLDQGLRDRAFSVFESYGLAPSQAIKLFLTQVADTRAVPLSFDHHAKEIPNAETRAAMEEAIAERAHPTAKRYDNLEDLIRDVREFVE